MFRMIVGIVLAAAIYAAARAGEQTVVGATISAADVLQRAQDRYKESGVIRASAHLEVNHPAKYASEIKLLAAPDGRERAEITATMRQDTWKSLQVVSDGVVWNESSTPVGPVVTKIDLRKVKEAMPPAQRGFETLPMLGTTGMFDLSNFARLLDFADAREETLGERKTYMVSGTLKERFRTEAEALPAPARRFYETARVWFDADTFFPYRIELGGTAQAPLMRLDFSDVETNVAIPDDAFVYSPPEGATIVDRTQWAIAELSGAGQAR